MVRLITFSFKQERAFEPSIPLISMNVWRNARGITLIRRHRDLSTELTESEPNTRLLYYSSTEGGVEGARGYHILNRRVSIRGE